MVDQFSSDQLTETSLKHALIGFLNSNDHNRKIIKDPIAAEDLAILLRAFSIVSHVPRKWKRKGLDERQEEACELVQAVCYQWNWTAHKTMTSTPAFRSLLQMPFMTKDLIFSGFKQHELACRNKQYDLLSQ